LRLYSLNGVVKRMPKRSFTEKGYVGETYVMAKLMRDFNIASAKVPQEYFSYDLITSNNMRLEVKTAIARDFERKHPEKTYHSLGWEFGRNPNQRHEDSCNFVVCICFKSQDMSNEPKCFIIPSKKLHGRKVFKITANPTKGEKKFWEYEDKWDSITKDA